MPNLFGHSQNQGLADVLPLIRRMHAVGPVHSWKAIDPDPATARAVSKLGIKLIVRHNVDIGPWVNAAAVAPRSVAGDFVDECRREPWFPYAWAIETPNEPMGENDGRLPQYTVFESECVRLFAELGKQCIVNNLGTGNDGHYVPGATYYGAHGYWWEQYSPLSPFNALRYRSWFPAIQAQEPAAKLFLTECGATMLVDNPGASSDLDLGWQGRKDVGIYQAELGDFAAAVRQDPYVLASFLFQVGGNPDWDARGFEHLGTPIEDWLVEHHRLVSLARPLEAPPALVTTATSGNTYTGENTMPRPSEVQASIDFLRGLERRFGAQAALGKITRFGKGLSAAYAEQAKFVADLLEREYPFP